MSLGVYSRNPNSQVKLTRKSWNLIWLN